MSVLQKTFRGLIGRTLRGPEPPHSRARCRALVCGLLVLLVAGCAGTEPVAAGAAPHPRPSSESALTPLLWQASRPGAGDLFLFGSVHVGPGEGRAFGPAVAASWAESDELVVEVDLSAISPAEVAAENAAHALLPPGQTLRDRLSEETYGLLSERLAERGMPMVAVEAMQPWAVASLLAVLEFQAAGYDVAHGVDRQLMDRAAGSLPIRGLETIASQMQMLSGLSADLQEGMLLDMLTRTETVEREVLDLMDAWNRGDEERLAALLFAPLGENPELAGFYDAVFFSRNSAMAGQLAALAPDGRRRFVVLGAGHMVGPRGIPALLAARGFAVEKLQPR